jgi:hypothetical protein
MEYLYDYIYYSLGYSFFRFSCSTGWWRPSRGQRGSRSTTRRCWWRSTGHLSFSLPRSRSILYLCSVTPLFASTQIYPIPPRRHPSPSSPLLSSGVGMGRRSFSLPSLFSPVKNLCLPDSLCYCDLFKIKYFLSAYTLFHLGFMVGYLSIQWVNNYRRVLSDVLNKHIYSC